DAVGEVFGNPGKLGEFFGISDVQVDFVGHRRSFRWANGRVRWAKKGATLDGANSNPGASNEVFDFPSGDLQNGSGSLQANPTSGGVTASTEMLAAKRHAGVHTPVIECKMIIANQQMAYAA